MPRLHFQYDLPDRPAVVKVRLRGQSIRFRLSRSDVAVLLRGDLVADRTVLGPCHEVALGLRLDRSVSDVTVVDERAMLVYALSPERLSALADDETVGFSADVAVGEGRMLHVLIEKDFVCLDGPAADNDDAFPNPSAACTPRAAPEL